jgi:hypothetical protein
VVAPGLAWPSLAALASLASLVSRFRVQAAPPLKNSLI